MAEENTNNTQTADSASSQDTTNTSETSNAADNNNTSVNSTDDAKNTVQGSIDVMIEPDEPKDFVPKLTDLMDKSKNLSRMSEQGIINEQTGAAVVVRSDGQINSSASKYSQYKLSPNGRTTEISMESVTMSNRKKYSIDEFLVNEHKLNPQLWELAEFRKAKLPTNQNAIVGDLQICGSVLVKAWEPNLKRYMLIRRPWRGPMFGALNNVPEINTALGVDDPLKLNEDILALTDKGYQVNAIIKDSASLIGKAGEDRPGIDRTSDAMSSSGGTSAGGSSGGGVGIQVTASAEASSIFQALRKLGYNDEAACGILGNIRQEDSTFDPHRKNDFGYTGLCQWDADIRFPRLCSQFPDPKCWDVGNQVSFILWECQNFSEYAPCLPENLNNAGSPEDCSEIFLTYYEGAKGQEDAERANFAKGYYQMYKGTYKG